MSAKHCKVTNVADTKKMTEQIRGLWLLSRSEATGRWGARPSRWVTSSTSRRTRRSPAMPSSSARVTARWRGARLIWDRHLQYCRASATSWRQTWTGRQVWRPATPPRSPSRPRTSSSWSTCSAASNVRIQTPNWTASSADSPCGAARRETNLRSVLVFWYWFWFGSF